MANFRDALFSRAFMLIQGADYNRARENIEEGREPGVSIRLFYELVLDDPVEWVEFRDRTFPRFVRYLQDKKYDPESPRGVLVAIFTNERCLLLHGRDFIGLLCELDDLNPAALHFRILQWLGG